MGAAEIAGASFEHTIGGQTFTFGPIGVTELGKCESWVKQRKLKLALSALPPNESNELRVILIKDLLNMSKAELKVEVSKPEAVCHLLWLSVVKMNPELKSDVFDEVITNASQAECDALADKLAAMGGEGKDGPPVNSVLGSGKA